MTSLSFINTSFIVMSLFKVGIKQEIIAKYPHLYLKISLTGILKLLNNIARNINLILVTILTMKIKKRKNIQYKIYPILNSIPSANLNFLNLRKKMKK